MDKDKDKSKDKSKDTKALEDKAPEKGIAVLEDKVPDKDTKALEDKDRHPPREREIRDQLVLDLQGEQPAGALPAPNVSRLDDPGRPGITADRLADLRAQAQKALSVMLNGFRLNRLKLAQHGIAADNSSLHSIISTIENELLVPVARELRADGIAEYWITTAERKRFFHQRRQQEEDQRRLVIARRWARRIREMERAVRVLDTYNTGLLASPSLRTRCRVLGEALIRVSKISKNKGGGE